MTTLKLTLPDRLAREAESAGLLKPAVIECLIRAEIRRRRVKQMFVAADRLAAVNLPPLSEAEIETEVRAVRAKRRVNARRR